MSIKKILKNVAYLFFGNISVRLIFAVATIVFARNIGPEEYGVFAVAVAFSSVVGYFTDSGLTSTYTREVTKKNSDIAQLTGSYFKVRVLLAFFSAVFSFFLINFFYDDPYLIKVISVVVYPTIFGATLQGVGNAFFQANERMQFSSAIMVVQGITASLAICLGIVFKFSLITIAALYGGASLLTGLFSIHLVLRYSTIHIGWNNAILKQLLSFTVNGIIIILLPQLGPIILEKVSTISEVGFFSTAYRIPAVLYQIPGVVAAAFYPRLFSLANNGDLENHKKLSQFELKLMSFIGMAVAMPFVLNPEFWIITLLGNEWAKSSIALAVLAFMIILQSINYSLADYLTTIGFQSKRTLVMSLGLMFAILGYVIFGFYYGMLGGAYAAILTEFILLIGFCFAIKRGFQFLLNGIKYNLVSFFVCILLYNFVKGYIPLLFLPLMVVLFGLFVFLLDKQVRFALLKLAVHKLRGN